MQNQDHADTVYSSVPVPLYMFSGTELEEVSMDYEHTD